MGFDLISFLLGFLSAVAVCGITLVGLAVSIGKAKRGK